MSLNVLPFTPTQHLHEAIIVSNGDHRASVAASRTDRRAEEIERLPFDLSALEEEGVFINVDATGFGILDRRLDGFLGALSPNSNRLSTKPAAT